MNLKHSGCNRNRVYKATKIWNECVYLFQKGMPVKRHRYHMRNFPDTFSGEEAANWLYGTLKVNSYFGQDITKTQVIQLLNKFFKSGVFEGIKSMKNFKAGKQLYRFKSNLSSETMYAHSVLPQSSIDNRVHIKDCKQDLVDTNNVDSVEKKNIADYRNKRMESDSLKEFKMRLKSEMEKEYWKREDLKTDFLMRLITEKIEKGKKRLNESIFMSPTSEDSSESSHSYCSTHDDHQSTKCLSSSTQHLTEHMLKLKSKCVGDHLMKSIVKRLDSVLGPHLNVSTMIPYDSIDPIWIVYNINTDMESFNDIGLPAWIIDAFACLGLFGDRVSKEEEEKYPGFYEDVYHILCENMINSCTGPLIPAELKKLVVCTFQFLENLNRFENDSKIVKSSTNMLASASETLKSSGFGFDNHGFSTADKKGLIDENGRNVDTGTSFGFCKQGLFTDCCYETAFTSDVPITRIILNQKSRIRRTCSVSSLREVNPNSFEIPVHPAISGLHYRHKEKPINYALSERNLNSDLIKCSNKFKSEKSTGNFHLKRSKSISTSISLGHGNVKQTASKSFSKQSAACNFNKENERNCYINYGMSVVDDNSLENGVLDSDIINEDHAPDNINYAEAIKNIYKLVQHSRLMTDKIENDSEGASGELLENHFSGCHETVEKIIWSPFIEYLGLTLYRDELLFLHPQSRITLNIILFLINYRNKEVEIKNELLTKLSRCILCTSKEDGVKEDKEITSIIRFLAVHRQEIMRYVDDIDDHYIKPTSQLSVVRPDFYFEPKRFMSIHSRENTFGVVDKLKNLRI